MIGRKTDSTKPVTLAEVRALLEVKEKTHELSFEQKTTLDYSQKVAKTTSKAARSMVDELVKIEKLTPDVAVKLVDMLPMNTEQLNAIVSKERYTLTEKEVGQILGILKQGADKPRPPPRKKKEQPVVVEDAEKAPVVDVSAEKAPVVEEDVKKEPS